MNRPNSGNTICVKDQHSENNVIRLETVETSVMNEYTREHRLSISSNPVNNNPYRTIIIPWLNLGKYVNRSEMVESSPIVVRGNSRVVLNRREVKNEIPTDQTIVDSQIGTKGRKRRIRRRKEHKNNNTERIVKKGEY